MYRHHKSPPPHRPPALGARGLVLLVTLLTAVLAPCAAQAETPRELAEQIIEHSGFSQQIAQIPALLQQQLAAMERDESTPAEVKALVSKMLLDAFEAKRLRADTITILLEQDAHPERMKQVLAFLDSDLGKRLTALEVAAGTPEGQLAIRDYAAGLAEKPPVESRVILIARLERVTLSSALAVEMTAAMVEAMFRGLSAARPKDEALTEEQIMGVSDQVRQRLAPRMLQISLITMHYTYLELSDAELEQALTFYGSDVGQWYVQAMAASFLGALSDSMERAATGIHEKFNEA